MSGVDNVLLCECVVGQYNIDEYKTETKYEYYYYFCITRIISHF